MFYIYIIYSESADKYYIGHTNEPNRRLEEHNNVIKNSYTFRYRPWMLKACFEVSESRGETRKVENYLKKMKSRKLIEKIITAIDPKDSCALGEPVEFLVNAKDDDGTVKTLYFFSKGRIRAEAKTDSINIDHTFAVSNLFPGENTVIAMAKDNDGRIGMSSMLRINIKK